MAHRVYAAIVKAMKEGKLKEPFASSDFRQACPGFANGTYQVFLSKHRRGNPGGNTELFEQVAKGKFTIIKPFKYGW